MIPRFASHLSICPRCMCHLSAFGWSLRFLLCKGSSSPWPRKVQASRRRKDLRARPIRKERLRAGSELPPLPSSLCTLPQNKCAILRAEEGAKSPLETSNRYRWQGYSGRPM